MKLVQKLTGVFFKATSLVLPATAASMAFRLFQTTRNKIRKNEMSLYENAKHFQIQGHKEQIDCYEIGNPKGELVLLLHGWDSNAGSMWAIASKLASLNYRVVAFNLPAHGTSNLKRTNLLESSHALLSVIGGLKPKGKISMVTHSFGSAVAAFTLSKVSYPIDKLMFLATPNQLISIFREFQGMISLGEKAFQIFLQKAEALLGEHPSLINVDEKMKNVSYNKFLILHDLFDKVIAHKSSLDVHKANPRSRLITTLRVGHYKMLWDQKVLNQVEDFFETSGNIIRKAS